jgi:hypothetical protein
VRKRAVRCYFLVKGSFDKIIKRLHTGGTIDCHVIKYTAPTALVTVCDTPTRIE